MKTYIATQGFRSSGAVFVVDGKVSRPLDPRLDLFNHSPTGLSWGYAGSGPAQLALALLADVLGDDHAAVRLHQAFKRLMIVGLDQDMGWSMTEEIIRMAAETLAAEQKVEILTKDERDLLEWLADEDFSQYGECHGKALDSLVEKGLAQIHEQGEHQSGFIAQGSDDMHRAVSLTDKGWSQVKT